MPPHRPQFGLALLVAAAALSGCVSSKYKAASKDTPPAVMVNLTAAQPPVEAVVHSVIVYHGPGAWKRDAYWDEYVVSFVNRGDVPLVIDSATLSAFQGGVNIPGSDPWTLDRESKTWWQNAKSSQAGNLLVLGAGTVGVAGALAFASFASLGPAWWSATAASTAYATAATAVVVAAPLYAVGVVVVNSNNKGKILAEFNRRRLVLPATLAPGQTVQGSLFFRISPGPQRLTLHGRAGNEPIEVAIDLTPLRGLHLKESTSAVSSHGAKAPALANDKEPAARPPPP
jgi:hypothetical protein